MSRVVEALRSLDRKERFAVLRDALGFHQFAPELDKGFAERLGSCIGLPVPGSAFVAMDYHLDWIQLAIHLAKTREIAPGTAFPTPSDGGDFSADQEDIDLLIAFDDGDADGSRTHLVLIEAKAYLPWSNEQLKSKAARLREMFGDDGTRAGVAIPHFVLMTNRRSDKIRTGEWPGWMKKDEQGNPFWLDYALPCRRKVTRCNASGSPDQDGGYLRLDPVPRPVKQRSAS